MMRSEQVPDVPQQADGVRCSPIRRLTSSPGRPAEGCGSRMQPDKSQKINI